MLTFTRWLNLQKHVYISWYYCISDWYYIIISTSQECKKMLWRRYIKTALPGKFCQYPIISPVPCYIYWEKGYWSKLLSVLDKRHNVF